jgi:U4/U6 small nuclear ribonucleoprotein PRP3
MADTASNLLKRPHPEDDGANDQKRARSNNGSPVPTSNGTTATQKPDIQKMVAEARARAEALRAKHAGALGGTASPSPSPSPAPTSPSGSSAMDRIAQLKARVAAATGRANAIAQ